MSGAIHDLVTCSQNDGIFQLNFAWFDNLRNNSNAGFGIRQYWNRRIRATSSYRLMRYV